MPRQARIVFPNIPYHITQRGNRREEVFFSDEDRLRYLALLKDKCDKHGVEILAYCLMTNHIHIIAVPSTELSLQQALRPLHTCYAQYINKKKGWKGHLWQGRFFSSALDDEYMWAAIRYVELNPVRAKLVRVAERYKWSSAPHHCGLRDDEILTKKRPWQRHAEQIADWSTWLAEGEQTQQRDVIIKHIERGLPCGAKRFIQKLEKAAGRTLEFRPQGRPVKVED